MWMVRAGSEVAPLLRPAFVYYTNAMPSISVIRKKKGRPATGQDPVRSIRLPDEVMEAVDRACEAEEDASTRSEVIRRILTDYLRKAGHLK